MRWFAVYWCLVCGLAGLGFYALYKAIYLLWIITGPLVDDATRHVDYFITGLWFSGFLLCAGCVYWLANLNQDNKDRVLTHEEES